MNTSILALRRGALAALLLLGVVPAQAIPFRVASWFNSESRQVHSTIYARELTPGSGATIGAFDFSFGFDPLVLDLEQVRFLPLLGSPDKRVFSHGGGALVPIDFGLGEALSSASLDPAGTLRISSVSLLETSADTCLFCTGPYLDGLQGSSVALVSLAFRGLVPISNANADTMGFEMSVLGASDGYGNPFLFNPVQFSPVPLPSTMALFGIGLLALLRRRPSRPKGV